MSLRNTAKPGATITIPFLTPSQLQRGRNPSQRETAPPPHATGTCWRSETRWSRLHMCCTAYALALLRSVPIPTIRVGSTEHEGDELWTFLPVSSDLSSSMCPGTCVWFGALLPSTALPQCQAALQLPQPLWKIQSRNIWNRTALPEMHSPAWVVLGRRDFQLNRARSSERDPSQIQTS